MSNNAVEDTELGEDEERRDRTGIDMVNFDPSPRVSRQRSASDMLGMLTGKVNDRRVGRKTQTVSDITGMMYGKEPSRPHRRREKSSTDVVRSFFDSPQLGFDADLRLAEKLAATGTLSSRMKADKSVSERHIEVPEREGDEVPTDFEFNEEGLTTEEAEKRLAQFGRNELPEKMTPKWLIFLQQFWAPMPIMIWLAIIIEAAIQNCKKLKVIPRLAHLVPSALKMLLVSAQHPNHFFYIVLYSTSY